MADPLVALPAEVVLQILDFVSISSLACLTRASRPWHDFIDTIHQDAIYSSPSKTEHPPGSRDFSFLLDAKSFAKYYDGVTNWKDLCRRQTLLKHNWANVRDKPTTRETVIQVGRNPVWRFRPDFKRRIIVSTSQTGGLNVSDMDDGRLLWCLPEDDVRPYAHLEYQDGTAVFDRFGNALEVWRAVDAEDGEGVRRGEFRQVAVLPHDCETRGYQLSFDTLCVVSPEGRGFVYDFDMSGRVQPKCRTQLRIEDDAIGHLDQCEDMVMYSVGPKGYHFYSKDSGEHTGLLHPKQTPSANVFHIRHPEPPPMSTYRAHHGPTDTVFPPQQPRKDRLSRLQLEKGPHPDRPNAIKLEDDDWGAGMLWENFMVGVSRGGRVFLCSDWRKALTSAVHFNAHSAIIETEEDGQQFDLGGWLSIYQGRCLFEVAERVYIFSLNQNGPLPEVGALQAPIYATNSTSAPQLTVPVSYMAVYDDCLMHTYTTLGRHAPYEHNRLRAFPTKAIRILSLAPDLSSSSDEAEQLEEDDTDPAPEIPTSPDGIIHAALLRIVDAITNHPGGLEAGEDVLDALGEAEDHEDGWVDESDDEGSEMHEG